MKSNLNIKRIISFFVGGVVLAGIFTFTNGNKTEERYLLEKKPKTEITEEIMVENNETIEEKTIAVYVTGEVKNPQVVELKEGSRLNDAVQLAGGLTEKADSEAVNLAMTVSDGAQYVIPAVGEELKVVDSNGSSNNAENSQGTTPSNSNTSQNQEGKININTADQKLLMELDGIGEALSERIINYREENGGFKSIEELKNVDGIGDKRYAAIKDKVCV